MHLSSDDVLIVIEVEYRIVLSTFTRGGEDSSSLCGNVLSGEFTAKGDCVQGKG